MAVSLKIYGLLLLAVLASCTAKDNVFSDLVKVPLNYQGGISSGAYTAKDLTFSVNIPFEDDGDNYRSLQIQERYSNDRTYISFGPGKNSDSIYRIYLFKTGESVDIARVGKNIVRDYSNQLETGYGSKFELVHEEFRTAAGSEAIYWQFQQNLSPGRMGNASAVQLQHEIYVINTLHGPALVALEARGTSESGSASNLEMSEKSLEEFVSSMRFLEKKAP